MDLTPKRAADSATEMVQVVLPNDANPLGFILGGTVMHLIDIAGAIACHRHTRSLLVTAAVDDLQFLHPIKVGDLIILKARVTCAFTTSLEVQVDVFSEETLTGQRQLTSRAFLTFVAIDRDGAQVRVPPLLVETEEERSVCEEAHARRAARLEKRSDELKLEADVRTACLETSRLRHVLRVGAPTALEVDADAVLAQELVADDAAELEAEQRARRVQVQHDHREVLVADRVERQVDARHQERVLIPARRAVDLQRDPARRSRACCSDVAVAWLIEITSPPVSTTKFAWCAAVDRAAHRRQPVQPQRQLEVRRLVRQVLAERQLVRLVVDDHRVAERERRQALGFLRPGCRAAAGS